VSVAQELLARVSPKQQIVEKAGKVKISDQTCARQRNVLHFMFGGDWWTAILLALNPLNYTGSGNYVHHLL
jgi:hypothetical protein